MSKQETLIGQYSHPASGLSIDIIQREGKRTYYTAALHGVSFRSTDRDRLERQIDAALDHALTLDWTPVIAARVRLDAEQHDQPAASSNLSLDRFWTLALPDGDLLRANWRSAEDDDNPARLIRAYAANLPGHFNGGALPITVRAEDRQTVYMPFSDAAWASLQQTADRLRREAAAQGQPAMNPAGLTVYTPPRVIRYEIGYRHLETLIRDHLEIDYPIPDGEHWSPDASNILNVDLNGYDDTDRAVIEQIRSGERCYYALEILMRVLAEQHVIPAGDYLITAR